MTHRDIEVVVADGVDQEIMEAVAGLMPQLSPSAPVPTAEQVKEIVSSTCTTLLLARDRAQAGRVIGMLTLAVFRVATGERAWIEDVVVDSGSRGRGAGEALCREALRIAATRGAKTVELTSRPSREAANQLYRRLGFELRETNLYRFPVRGR